MRHRRPSRPQRRAARLGANLSQADLTGADLTGATVRAQEHGYDAVPSRLDGIVYDRTTIWPEGFTPPTSASEVDS